MNLASCGFDTILASEFLGKVCVSTRPVLLQSGSHITQKIISQVLAFRVNCGRWCNADSGAPSSGRHNRKDASYEKAPLALGFVSGVFSEILVLRYRPLDVWMQRYHCPSRGCPLKLAQKFVQMKFMGTDDYSSKLKLIYKSCSFEIRQFWASFCHFLHGMNRRTHS